MSNDNAEFQFNCDRFLANLPPESESVTALVLKLQEQERQRERLQEALARGPAPTLYARIGDPPKKSRRALPTSSRAALAEGSDTFEYTPGVARADPPASEVGDDVEVVDELQAVAEEFGRRVCDHYGDPTAVKERNGKIACRCPAHDDSKPSLGLRVGDDKIVMKCLAGCRFEDIVAAVGMKPHQFFRGLTLAELADEKQIPVSKLQAWGVMQAGKRISMDYLRDGGVIACTRFRQRESDDRPKIVCKTGDTLALYGEYTRHLPSAKDAGYAVFVEGESDCWTLWLKGIPAFGVPGATCSSVIMGRHLQGLKTIYVWQEPGRGGVTFVAGVKARLQKLGFNGSLVVLKHDKHKDPSDLHCSGADWEATWADVISAGVPVPLATEPHADPDTPEEPRGRHRYSQMGQLIVDAMRKDGSHPLYTGGHFYTYSGDHYAEAAEPEMLLRRYFQRWDWPTSTAIVSNVVAEVQSRGWTGHRQELPFWRNPGPCDAANVIAYRNGLLDIATGQLHPHTPDWCSTQVLPYDYDTAATCPHWLAFLNSVYEGDAGRIALLQEYLGYLLSQDASHEKALVLTGKPRSGKSTIHRIATLLVGEENATGFSLEKLASEFGSAMLVGKSLATVPEVELSGSRERAKILELWKRIIGRDSVDVNVKHKPQITVRLGVRFLVAANDIPRLYDASGAMSARLIYLPHEVSFLGREDRDLGRRLERELPGIATWSLAGLKRLRSVGEFTMPTSSRRIADMAAVETTPVRAWIRESLEIEPACDPGDMPGVVVAGGRGFATTKNGLYNSYSRWAEDHDMEAGDVKSQVWFFRELRSILPKLAETKITDVGGVRLNAYKGVRLRQATSKAA